MTTLASPSPTLDTSSVPGSVINHLPAADERYVGSPGLAVLPNGDYVASHDMFGPGSKEYQLATSLVFRSTDQGNTWSKIAQIPGMFWGTLFVHNDALYLMGTDKCYGNAVIRRSTDGGETWTEAKDAKSGLLLTEGGHHCAPVPMLIHNGRIWRAMEDVEGKVKGWGTMFRAFMMSAPVDADLLDADNWTCSNRIDRDGTWLNDTFHGWLEGNAVATPDGQVVDMLRVAAPGPPEYAAIVRISEDGKTATFDSENDFIEFPGGAKKFTIRYDAKTDYYWTLSNYVPEKHAVPKMATVRNTIALMRSRDLRNWEVRSIVLYHPEPTYHGFQYIEWLFEGDDLIVASRSGYDDGLGGSHTVHDANFLTFHRVKDFRNAQSPADVIASPEGIIS